MANDLEELAAVLNDALSMLQKVGANVNDHRKSSSKLHAQILKLVNHANDRIEEANQRLALQDRMIQALIAELVKSQAVDGKAVAARFLESVESRTMIFQPHYLAQANHLAEQLSHPGFPDALPQPRGMGPTLIVDNDPSDS